MPTPPEGRSGPAGARSPGRSAARSPAPAGARSSGPAGARSSGPAGARSSGSSGARSSGPVGAHEWISFEDPGEDRTWVFDVTFLLSSWTCIFGCGCKGVLTAPSPHLGQGCCSYGAHFTGKEDVERVEAAAATLTPQQWQYKGRARCGVVKITRAGEQVTRMADGACIFLNRPGWPGGPGCALHRAALERGVPPLRLKPDVCWQLPLRREDRVDGDGHVVSTVGEWSRRHWGEGGKDFAWWCTEGPEAFSGSQPVYRTMAEELMELVGRPAYDMLKSYLDERASGPRTPVPHPSARRPPARGLC